MSSDVILDFHADGYDWLSNFWEFPDFVSPIDGMKYPTLEHAYQAAKWDARDYKVQIAHCPTPGAAKRMGNTFPPRGDWDQRKTIVMHALLRRKFRPGSHLAEMLMATGDAELIEGNTHGDHFWGRKLSPCRTKVGTGRNMLGMLLMEVRGELCGAPARVLPYV